MKIAHNHQGSTKRRKRGGGGGNGGGRWKRGRFKLMANKESTKVRSGNDLRHTKLSSTTKVTGESGSRTSNL